MRLVVDTNPVISALVKDSVSRRILASKNFNFISPEFVFEEVMEYKEMICGKSGMAEDDFELLADLIFSNIEILPQEVYNNFMDEAKEIIGKMDIKDVPFVACALAIGSEGIWSDDTDFDKQDKVKVWKTRDLIGFI